MIIATSRLHGHGGSDAIGGEVKLRAYIRKKAIHSGIGVDRGLEQRLKERKLMSGIFR